MWIRKSFSTMIIVGLSLNIFLFILKAEANQSFPIEQSPHDNTYPVIQQRTESLKEAENYRLDATSLYEKGEYTKALPLFEKYMVLCEENLGSEHLDTATAQNNLAHVYSKMGCYSKALPLSEKAYKTCEKNLGRNHPDTAKALGDMAAIYALMGDNTKAITEFRKAVFICQNTLGSNNQCTAHALNNLAAVYTKTGDFSEALPLFERALAIYKKVLRPDHPDIAEATNNIAEIYLWMGNCSKARPLFETALAIWEKSLDPWHPYTGRVLNNLGCVYTEMGCFNEALSFHQKAFAIREKVFGVCHFETASSLINLAVVYEKLGYNEEALLLYKKALAINEKALGTEHPYTAMALLNLAAAYFNRGSYSIATPLFEKALLISQKTSGRDHPDTFIFLMKNAVNKLLSGGDINLIKDMMQRLYLGRLKSLNSILEMDELSRLSWQQKNLNLPLIDFLSNAKRCDFILKTKGIVLDSLVEDQAAIKSLDADSPEAIEVRLDRLQIGKLAFSTRSEDQKEVARLKARIDSILSSTAGKRVNLGGVRQSATITPSVISSYLPAGGALIEFVQFFDPKIKGYASRCYGALILGLNGESKFVRIDDAAGIDSSILGLRKAIARGDENALIEQQKLLSEKLWTPISTSLPEGIKKLFIGADGQLNFLSFAALPAADGSFLSEHYDIAYVGSGRDLARKVSATDSKSIALFADPIFDRQASAFSTNVLALRSGEVDAFGQIVLPPLPGTRAEEAAVEEVAKAGGWSPEAKLGEAATKSAIMDMKSPGILHLATHGFYLNTLSESGAEGVRGMKLMEVSEMPGSKPVLPKIDPMHASGIALTGAQATLKAWSEGRVPDSKEDGILTAEEVGALNLDGTWLVTLSACETGVGEARSGEGVFGLRRAFMIAGAQNLLMTLWPVSDEVTPKIMADFYKEALATHDAAGSLAKVQRDWLVKLRKEKGLLAAVRDAGPFAMVVMAKQDSTFSSPSTATPIAAPQAPAN